MGMTKKCVFCKHKDENRKIPATACNRCRVSKEHPFGSKFIEYYCDYPWDRRYLKGYIKSRNLWESRGIVFEKSWKPVPEEA